MLRVCDGCALCQYTAVATRLTSIDAVLSCGSLAVVLQALFRRAQLKALVTMHSIEENFGGHLSATEINIIGGALDLTNKTAAHGMTPLDKANSSAQLAPSLHIALTS